MAGQIEENPQDRPKAKSIGPMRGLAPFVAPYRVTVVFALTALVVTAALSLALPLALPHAARLPVRLAPLLHKPTTW